MSRIALDVCALAPPALTLAALPFAEENGVLLVYGIYFALPALLAWLVLRLRAWLPAWARATLGVVMVPWILVMTAAAAWAGKFIPVCLLSIGVVAVVAWRLLVRL